MFYSLYSIRIWIDGTHIAYSAEGAAPSLNGYSMAKQSITFSTNVVTRIILFEIITTIQNGYVENGIMSEMEFVSNAHCFSTLFARSTNLFWIIQAIAVGLLVRYIFLSHFAYMENKWKYRCSHPQFHISYRHFSFPRKLHSADDAVWCARYYYYFNRNDKPGMRWKWAKMFVSLMPEMKIVKFQQFKRFATHTNSLPPTHKINHSTLKSNALKLVSIRWIEYLLIRGTLNVSKWINHKTQSSEFMSFFSLSLRLHHARMHLIFDISYRISRKRILLKWWMVF